MRPAALGAGDFARLSRLVAAEAGIHLAPPKKALVEARLARRLRELGCGYGDYCRLVVHDAAERTRMIEALCTHETRFFREPRQLEFLEQRLLPAWRAQGEAGQRPRRVRAWSAACSTGEEAWTAAMLLRAAFPGWSLEVLATDLSTRALERARTAVYPLAAAAGVPAHHRRAFLLRGTGPAAGTVKVDAGTREIVRFARQNLNDDAYAVDGSWDLVFCRNVLIYFDGPTKARVVEQLRRRLAPGGCLLLGQAECLTGHAGPLRLVGPMTWTEEPR